MSEYAIYLFPIVWLASVLMTGWACYHEGRFRGYNEGWRDGYELPKRLVSVEGESGQ